MKETLKNLSDIVAKANDVLYIKYKDIDTIMGIIDKALRNQGIKADAVSVECVTADKKILILVQDDKPDFTTIVIGNKSGDIYSKTEYKLNEMTQEFFIEIMESHFIR